MKLLDLPSGRVSLEFDGSERSRLFAQLRSLGVSQVRHATHDVLTIHGQTFLYMDEWDEPCLISMSPAGDTMLREIGGGGIAYARTA